MNPSQQEALNPETPPERLWELAVSHHDPELVNLLLVSIANTKKILVIKVLKSISRVSLYTVKKWTDDMPCFINRRGIRRAAAGKIRSEVIAVGGVLELQAKVSPGEYAALVAQNPAAPVELLWALGSCEDAEIRQIILQHPLLPQPLLFILGAEFPEVFLQSPVTQLAMLEDPEAFFRWPDRVQAALLALPDISVDLLRRVIVHSSSNLRKTALAHPKITAALLDELSAHNTVDLRADIAANNKTSHETLTRLSKDHTDVVRGAIAQNPNTPLEILRKLSTARAPISGYVAQNPSTSLEILLEIANSTSEKSLYTLKNNEGLSSSSLEVLAKSRSISARLAAASHPNASPELLELLSSDNEADVVCGVAQNPKASEATLEKLAFAGDIRISEGVASNPKLSGALLQKFIQQHQGKEYWDSLLVTLAQNPSLSEDFCARFLPTMPITTRRALAVHNKHQAVLAMLSQDSSREVRIAVAQNPNAGPSTLATLENDPEPSVRQQATARHQHIEWSS